MVAPTCDSARGGGNGGGYVWRVHCHFCAANERDGPACGIIREQSSSHIHFTMPRAGFFFPNMEFCAAQGPDAPRGRAPVSPTTGGAFLSPCPSVRNWTHYGRHQREHQRVKMSGYLTGSRFSGSATIVFPSSKNGGCHAYLSR